MTPNDPKLQQTAPRVCQRPMAMAGVTIQRPSGNVAVDETFKRAPKAKANGPNQEELSL